MGQTMFDCGDEWSLTTTPSPVLTKNERLSRLDEMKKVNGRRAGEGRARLNDSSYSPMCASRFLVHVENVQ